MIIFKKTADLNLYIERQKKKKKTIGFVPTMGALHQGHLSLIETCQHHCAITVVSIFVNPAQFNDPKDFEKYPITTEKDCVMLERKNTDVLFIPSTEEIYPHGFLDKKYYDLGALALCLEGLYRPGHFQGVCQVVERLLEIILPDKLFLGQKDYQQCMVLKKLIDIMKIPTNIFVVPTLREPNGVAMSSRNLLLNPIERQQAAAIYAQLKWIQENWDKNTIAELKTAVTQYLLKSGFQKVDYVEIVNAENLQSLYSASSHTKAVALIAAFIGQVRLIDNLIIHE